MSRLTEIQKVIEELAPDEKEQLRDWLDVYDPALEREWAAIAQELPDRFGGSGSC